MCVRVLRFFSDAASASGPRAGTKDSSAVSNAIAGFLRGGPSAQSGRAGLGARISSRDVKEHLVSFFRATGTARVN
jgi:hypothetical protein